MLHYDKQDQPDQLKHHSDISSNFVKVVEGENLQYVITMYDDVSGKVLFLHFEMNCL